MKRDGADFDVIPDHLAETDRRLREWATWCNGNRTPARSPMFRDVKPSQQWEAAEPRQSVSPLDAYEVELILRDLSDGQAKALRWCYLWCWPVGRAARVLFAGDHEALSADLDSGRERVCVLIAGGLHRQSKRDI
jgi:hypothetical protein